MLERIEDIDNQIRTISLEIDDRLESIEKLSHPNYQAVLFLRYSEYKTFEEIAVDMKYAYNYVCTLHGEALEELTKLIN